MTIVATGIALVLAVSPLDPWIENPNERRASETAWNALAADPELSREVHAYYHYLREHPTIVHGEALVLRALQDVRVRAAAGEFIEALDREASARGLYARVYAEPRPRSAELFDALARETDPAGVRLLQSDPELAERFSANPATVQPLPDALRPLSEAIRYDRELKTRLERAVAQLTLDLPDASAHAAWWRRIYAGGDDDLAAAFAALSRLLEARPALRHAWEGRNFAWAAESPESLASAWRIDARCRQAPAVEAVRVSWFELFRRQPEAWEEFDAAFRPSEGTRPVWPLPAGSVLPELDAKKTRPEAPTAVERQQSREEQRPVPTPPERPSATARPTRPDPNLGGETERPKPPTPTQPSATP